MLSLPQCSTYKHTEPNITCATINFNCGYPGFCPSASSGHAEKNKKINAISKCQHTRENNAENNNRYNCVIKGLFTF